MARPSWKWESSNSGRKMRILMWREGHTPKTPKSETETQNGNSEGDPTHERAPSWFPALFRPKSLQEWKPLHFLAESRNFFENLWIGRTMSERESNRATSKGSRDSERTTVLGTYFSLFFSPLNLFLGYFQMINRVSSADQWQTAECENEMLW